MKALYDDQGSHVGWTNKALEQALTPGCYFSQERVIPKEVVAPYVVTLADRTKVVCGSDIEDQVRMCKRHARRVTALQKLREERDAIAHKDRAQEENAD